jgi:hypothetical protein
LVNKVVILFKNQGFHFGGSFLLPYFTDPERNIL